MARKPQLKDIVNRAFQVKPLREDPWTAGKLHWLDPLDLVRDDLMDQLQTRGEAKGLSAIGTFDVAIPTGFRSFPRPTQSQILPEIPAKMMKEAVAFKLNFNRSSSGEDGEEIATVTVYKGPVPQDIKDQPVRADGRSYKNPQKTSKPAAKPKQKQKKPAAKNPATKQPDIFTQSGFTAEGDLFAPPRAVFRKHAPKPEVVGAQAPAELPAPSSPAATPPPPPKP